MADYPKNLARWITAALAMTFGLQLLRVFMATTNFYLVDAAGAPPAIGGIVALLVFMLGSLSPLVAASGGRRVWVLRMGGVFLAVIRVAEQIIREPAADLVVSAIGVTAFLAILSSLVSGPGRSAGVGLLVGVAADVFLHGAAWTLDLSWQDGIVPLGVVAVLAVALAGSVLRSPMVNGQPGWSAVALGPWLVLQMVVFSNVAFAGSVTGLSLPAAWLLIGAGTAGALAVASTIRLGGWSSAGAAVLVVASVLVVNSSPEASAAALAIAGGQSGAGVLLVSALRPGRGGRSTAVPLGLLAMVVLLFGYYGSYQFDMGFRSSLVLFAAAVTVAAAGLTRRGPALERLGDRVPVATAAALLVPALVVAIYWSPPAFVTSQGLADLRIMSYNLHQGFNTSGRLDVEALAQVIEAEKPDILALQEVSRGWVVDGSLDLLAWLSSRLEMPYVSGPTADGQWGNAVLSRYPIVASRNIPLPGQDLPLRRAYLDVEVDLGGEVLRVLATHLHHVGADEEIRELQAELLLMGWSGTPRTVLLGDLNATPESSTMQALESWFVDAAFADGIRRFTSPAGDPTKTIDYILLSADLVASEISVRATEASDHLPVAVTVTLP